MIGNEESARRALAGTLTMLSCEGSTRDVYLDGDTVYKTNRYLKSSFNDNLTEYENLTILSSMLLSHDLAVPKFNKFVIDGETIIAMEYIDGKPVGECYCTPDEECDDACLPSHMVDYVRSSLDFVLDSLSYGNIIWSDNKLYIIDAGA